MIKSKTKCRGFTLTELIITMVILAIVLTTVLTMLFQSQESFDFASAKSSLETRSSLLIDRLTQHLPECKIVSAPVTGTHHGSITIQIPVLVTGTYWSADGASINWGANNQPGWTITYQYVVSNTLVEATTGFDYNGDGDLGETYDSGEIQMVFKDSGGTVQGTHPIGADIVTVHTDWENDLDGNGALDPIFYRVDQSGNENTINGNRIIVNFYMIAIDGKGRVIFMNKKESRTLRNPQ
ncbi:MAG: type II secretion system protein [Planctomycetes bacterium]|nr:type II secretion system protein [Planctomycetota bacterium]